MVQRLKAKNSWHHKKSLHKAHSMSKNSNLKKTNLYKDIFLGIIFQLSKTQKP